jgi:acetyl esterase/lipase
MIMHPASVVAKFVLVILVAAGSLLAQEYRTAGGILRDSSYTSHSAALKIYKKFPSVKLVLPRLPKTVVEKKDIVYTAYGSRELHLDVFMPSGRGNEAYPGILIIHGGGWVSGERSMLVPMAEQLAKHGFVAVTAEYRLGPEALYPAGVYDLKAAIRWMRAAGPEYGIDTNRIAAYGCSAGGELAAFLGTTGDNSKFEGNGGYLGHSSRVQAVVDVDGLLDFTNVNSTKYDNNPEKPSAAHRWFGASYKDNQRLWREASPITYVGKSTPPVIFINSSMSHYHAGRDNMVAEMKKLGIYYEVHTIPGTPHTFWLFHPWFGKTLGYTVAFLDRVLKANSITKES